MAELIRDKLVIPINPNRVISRPDQVADAFLRYVTSGAFNIKKRREGFRILFNRSTNRADVKYIKTPKIHNGKFDYELFRGLKDVGLAKRDGKHFFLVERKTANELMLFLASILSLRLNYLPSTDTFARKSFKPINLKGKHIKLYEREKEKREILLDELIPVPQQIDLTGLRRFKDSNFELLKRFKNTIELIALDKNIYKNSDIFDEKVKELKHQKREIAAKMNESKIAPVFAAFSGIVGAMPGLYAEKPELAVMGAIGLAGTVVAAANIENPKSVIDQTGLKYLALVDNKLRTHEKY